MKNYFLTNVLKHSKYTAESLGLWFVGNFEHPWNNKYVFTNDHCIPHMFFLEHIIFLTRKLYFIKLNVLGIFVFELQPVWCVCWNGELITILCLILLCWANGDYLFQRFCSDEFSVSVIRLTSQSKSFGEACKMCQLEVKHITRLYLYSWTQNVNR